MDCKHKHKCKYIVAARMCTCVWLSVRLVRNMFRQLWIFLSLIPKGMCHVICTCISVCDMYCI